MSAAIQKSISIMVAVAMSGISVACAGAGPTESNMAGSVELSLVAPDEVSSGAVLPVLLRAENTADDTVTFSYGGFPDRIYFDVVVTRSDGTVVWNRLHGQTVLRRSASRVLEGGEVIELSSTWELRDNNGQPVQPGTYRIRGVVLGAGNPDLSTEPTTLVIAP